MKISNQTVSNALRARNSGFLARMEGHGFYASLGGSVGTYDKSEAVVFKTQKEAVDFLRKQGDVDLTQPEFGLKVEGYTTSDGVKFFVVRATKGDFKGRFLSRRWDSLSAEYYGDSSQFAVSGNTADDIESDGRFGNGPFLFRNQSDANAAVSKFEKVVKSNWEKNMSRYVVQNSLYKVGDKVKVPGSEEVRTIKRVFTEDGTTYYSIGGVGAWEEKTLKPANASCNSVVSNALCAANGIAKDTADAMFSRITGTIDSFVRSMEVFESDAKKWYERAKKDDGEDAGKILLAGKFAADAKKAVQSVLSKVR